MRFLLTSAKLVATSFDTSFNVSYLVMGWYLYFRRNYLCPILLNAREFSLYILCSISIFLHLNSTDLGTHTTNSKFIDEDE